MGNTLKQVNPLQGNTTKVPRSAYPSLYVEGKLNEGKGLFPAPYPLWYTGSLTRMSLKIAYLGIFIKNWIWHWGFLNTDAERPFSSHTFSQKHHRERTGFQKPLLALQLGSLLTGPWGHEYCRSHRRHFFLPAGLCQFSDRDRLPADCLPPPDGKKNREK